MHGSTCSIHRRINRRSVETTEWMSGERKMGFSDMSALNSRTLEQTHNGDRRGQICVVSERISGRCVSVSRAVATDASSVTRSL